MSDFYKLHFNSSGNVGAAPGVKPMVMPERLRGLLSLNGPTAVEFGDSPESAARATQLQAASGEHAARYYAEELLKAQGSERLLAITDPASPALVPNLRMIRIEPAPLTKATVVTFEQTTHAVPVFGTKAVVELAEDDNRLVAFDAKLAAAPLVSPIATLSAAQAFSFLLKTCGVSEQAVPQSSLKKAPQLCYFQEEAPTQQWHLAYHFNAVPAVPPNVPGDTLPPEFQNLSLHGCCDSPSPREESPNYDYLVDAQNGVVLFWYSSAPRADVPVPCTGEDETRTNRRFFGLNTGAIFALQDPQRNISTYDMGFAVLNPLGVPNQPVANPTANFMGAFRAAISAHYNATLVFDFFNNVLKRKGVDNKGMLLKSVINVVETAGTRNWPNAAWWQGHMWYGQAPDGSGGYTSYSRHLDIIGHELTHGVTETTAGLIYAHLSGALNESFSDLFGILINNWDPVMGFRPVQTWSWVMGPGLGRQGGPIRDFANPAATGQPTNFSQYRVLPNTSAGDWGGVHYYSGIHNRAAHGVLTAGGPGQEIFSPTEVAILYYLTLTKLTVRSDFSDCRQTLLNVAAAYYSFDTVEQQKRLQLITAAYNAVGIP